MQPPLKSEDREQLKNYFVYRLDQLNLHYDAEPLSYGYDSQYDQLAYQLQAEAQQYWKNHFGRTPTPGQLVNAFNAAEFERARRERLKRDSLLARLKRWLTH